MNEDCDPSSNPPDVSEDFVKNLDSFAARLAAVKQALKQTTIKVLYKAEGFVYSLIHQPETTLVNVDPAKDRELNEIWTLLIEEEAKSNEPDHGFVCGIEVSSPEEARKEILDRIVGMLDMAFMDVIK